jgi:hypothetical protein
MWCHQGRGAAVRTEEPFGSPDIHLYSVPSFSAQNEDKSLLPGNDI